MRSNEFYEKCRETDDDDEIQHQPQRNTTQLHPQPRDDEVVLHRSNFNDALSANYDDWVTVFPDFFVSLTTYERGGNQNTKLPKIITELVNYKPILEKVEMIRATR